MSNQSNSGISKLYLVPTPIGNLEDITLRALRILKEVDIILAEDTRQTHKLLSHYGISKDVFPYHLNNEHQRVEQYVQRIIGGQVTALVSDAGTPGISDPGFLLVRACIQNHISVESLPGPSALTTALVASGLPCDAFVFEGFLPHKKGRQTTLKKLAQESRTIVLYESPHRIKKLLLELQTFFSSETQVVIGRELTKIHEEYIRGNVTEVSTVFEKREPKGEMVVIINQP